MKKMLLILMVLAIVTVSILQSLAGQANDEPVLLAPTNNAMFVRYDSGYIYFSEYGTHPEYTDGNISRVPAIGGEVQILVSGERTPTDISFDSEYVYYIAHDAGRIMRIKKADLTLETFMSGLDHPVRIAVYADSVYFTERDGNKLWRVFKNGTTHPNYPIAGDHPFGLALDSEFVYFTEWGYPLPKTGNIKKVPLEGGNPVTIASMLQPFLNNIAVDSDYVYYSETPVLYYHGTSLGDIGRVPKDGGPVEPLAEDQHCPFELVVHKNFVYFVEQMTTCEDKDGNIKRVPKSGGDLETLVSGFNPHSLCIESNHLYFAETCPSGGLYRLPLPVLPATIDVKPDTLNLKSKGKWITVYIELSEGYDVSDIDVSTVLLNDTIFAESDPTGIGDEDEDGVPDLMVKFSRSLVIDYVKAHIDWSKPERTKPLIHNATLTITGALHDGTSFEGSDTVRTLKFLKGHPEPE